MRAFEITRRDNERNIMRLELTGEDIDLIEAVIERLVVLEAIESALDVVSVRGPFILSKDIPTVTKQGRELLLAILKGWGFPLDSGEVVEVA